MEANTNMTISASSEVTVMIEAWFIQMDQVTASLMNGQTKVQWN